MDDVAILAPYLSERRRARIEEVLARRTRSLTVVFEAVHDPHNVAAVLRSAEAFGLQEVHAIRHPDAPDSWSRRITKSADKWIDARLHSTIEACFETLKREGYSIQVSDLSGDAASISAVDFAASRTALVFGNEKDGVSMAARSLADGRFVLPMRGFMESFNVSVAAALALFHATNERAALPGGGGDLGEAEKQELRRRWYSLSVRGSEGILNRARAAAEQRRDRDPD